MITSYRLDARLEACVNAFVILSCTCVLEFEDEESEVWGSDPGYDVEAQNI
jgi:hypothetical protein